MELHELERQLTEDVNHIAKRHSINTDNLIVNIQTAKKAYGSFAKRQRKEGEMHKDEIALNPEYFNDPMELLDTIIHELVHMYCDQNAIKETSRQGSYHNKKFKEIAEKFGLKCVQQKNGWNTTADGNTYLKYINNDLPYPIKETMIRRPIENARRGSRNHSIKYTCPICGTSCRATKKIRIICMECEEEMTADNEE